jgi:hypothetical protein
VDDHDEMMNWIAEGAVTLTAEELADLHQQQAEVYAEGAWLRAAEAGDDETRHDLAQFDAMFPGRYSDGPIL